MKNFHKFLMEMGQNPSAPGPVAPKPDIGEDYGKLRQQVAQTVKDLEEVLQKYEGRIQQLHTLLGVKGAAISGKMAGQSEQIEKMKSQIAEMGEQIGTLKAEHENSVRKFKQAIAELEEKNRGLEADKARIAGDSQKLMQNANHTLEESMLKVQRLEEDLEAAKAKFEAEARSHNDTIGQKQALGQELDREKAAHGITRGERDSERAGRDSLQASFDNLQEMMSKAMEILEQENGRLEQEVKRLGGHAAYAPSEKKSKPLDSTDFKPMDAPDFSKIPITKPDMAHTNYGGFDIREHLAKAAKRQGVKRSWF